ncbi:MAG: helix-turn-helix domain-containing protein [Pseudonocardiaceae bacterium]
MSPLYREVVAASAGDELRPVNAPHPWETAELLRRLELSDVGSATLDGLQVTVEQLCCDYSQRPADELRHESQRWLSTVATLLRGAVGLRAHRELMVSAGWLALLVGCVEYDLGMVAAAESTRRAAASLGRESDHAQIVAWSHEMSAWFAVTQGRFRESLDHARAGQEAAPSDPVSVQLGWQEAKALARFGEVRKVADVLDRGYAVLDKLPRPRRPDNHFVIDPGKWDLYAMDCYRMAGLDDLAAEHARIIIGHHVRNRPAGVQRAPMRVAEAKLTLGVVAARRGEAEEAVNLGHQAFATARKSLPSLLSCAAELDRELIASAADSDNTREFRDEMRRLRASRSGFAADVPLGATSGTKLPPAARP